MTIKIDALESQVIAVIREVSPERALAKAEQWLKRGTPAIEVTWTVPDAAEVCRLLVAKGAPVAAGTITTEAQACAAIEAGVKMLVSPVNPRFLLPFALDAAVIAVPGAATPSEIFQAASDGAQIVKVFPAARLGGPAFVKDVLAPLPDLKLMCTGGITIETSFDYFNAGAYCVGLSKF